MSAHNTAQFVREPFRTEFLKRAESRHAIREAELEKWLGLSKGALRPAINRGALAAWNVGQGNPRYCIWAESLTPALAAELRLPPDPEAPMSVTRVEPLPVCEAVYFIGGVDGFVKIGWSNNILQRMATLQTACPVKLRILAICLGGCRDEHAYHHRFRRLRAEGEWFRLGPAIEREIARLNGLPPPSSLLEGK